MDYLVGKIIFVKNQNAIIKTVNGKTIEELKVSFDLDGVEKAYMLMLAIRSKTIVFESDDIQKEIEKLIVEYDEHQKEAEIAKQKAHEELMEKNRLEALNRKDEAPAIKRSSGSAKRTIGSPESIENDFCLIQNKTYGTNGHEIYLMCCKVFGFRTDKHGHFVKQQSMYADDATPEGYSVWFLPHSNLTGTKSEGKNNVIAGDLVKFSWDNKKHNETKVNKGERRLLFVKDRGVYYFAGLIECVEADIEACTSTFKVISDTYSKC